MTLAEVQQLLGVAPGDYRMIRIGSTHGGFGPTDAFGSGERIEVRQNWCGDKYWIQIGFDRRGKVVAGFLGLTPQLSSRPLWWKEPLVQ
jgi:hypothetical protein